MTTVLLSLASIALAQDSDAQLDAHGFHLAPGDGRPLDFLSTWRPTARTSGGFAVDGLFEYADSPLVLMKQQGDTVEREVLVDNLAGLDLGATYSLMPRLGVSLAVPVYFASIGPNGASGLGLGDARLAVPVGIVLPVDGGFGLSVVPFADLPTGAGKRFLGNQGFAGGLVVAAGYETGRLALAANVGVDATPGIDYENLRGGTHLLASAGVGYGLTDTVALRGELAMAPSLSPNEVALSESPGEAILSARVRTKSGLGFTLGGSTAVTRGAGAAAYRIFAGVGFGHAKPADPDTDGDGLTDSKDACPSQPETVNAWNDTDGCPDQLSGYTLRILDEDGNKVPGATVVLGGQTYTADGDGVVHLDGKMPGTTLEGGTAVAPVYAQATVGPVTLAEGANEQVVKLSFLPGKVRVITKSNGGAIVDAKVRFDGPAPRDPQEVGDDGQEVFELRPGQWRLLISADSFGTERRDLEIKPGETSLIVIEVTMYPTKTEVKATEIKILEQVNFDFDKDSIMAASLPLLDQVANVLLDHPEIKKVEVQGHTDDKGNDAYNLELSQRRVDSVRKYLISRGVAEDRLVAVGYGETKPIASNKTEKGRAQNRRVVFEIVDPPPPAPETTPATTPASPDRPTAPASPDRPTAPASPDQPTTPAKAP